MSFGNLKGFGNKKNKKIKIQQNMLQSFRHQSLTGLLKRTFFSPLRLKGVLTIEAAVIIPLFLLFILGISSLMIILGLQASIQTELENTARTLGQKAYYIEKTGTEALGLNPLSVRASMFSGNLRDIVGSSSIEGGASGMSFALTTYDVDEGILDIVVTYRYKIPFLPAAIPAFNFTQRAKSHVWIGRKLDMSGDEGEEAEKKTVFVTETGTVYHLSRDCTYLALSVRSVDRSKVSELRNKSGAKYYACPMCGWVGAGSSAYITDYGTCFHSSLSCSGLKRTIKEVDISEAGDMPACSKCGGGG